MNELPDGWAEVRLDELLAPEPAAVTDGPFGSNLKTEHYTATGPRVIRLQNVGDGVFRDERAYISAERFEALRKHEARAGDVIIAALGETLPRACVVPLDVGPAIVKADCIRVRVHPDINAHFVNAMLNSPPVRREATARISGVGRPRLNLAKIRSIVLPLPPRAEQDRIVAVIEEQFSRLDAGLASLVRARRSAPVLREAAISAWLPSETSTEGLIDVCDAFSDCEHRTPRYSEVGVPALRPRDVVGGSIALEGAARVTSAEFEMQTRRHVPKAGDLVYSRELSYGWAAVVPDGVDLCLSQGMVVFRPSSRVLPQYLAAVLNSVIGRRQAHAAATGSAHPHINVRDIKAYPVPIPPIEVQRRIVENIERASSVVESALESIDQSYTRAAALRRCILNDAFSGRLVSQDPNDEPASELIAGIAAERVDAPKPRRRQRV